MNTVKCRELLITDCNSLIDNRPMMNNASMKTVSKGSLTRKMERWLLGVVMMIIAYLVEKVVLRSIKRSDTKFSAQDNSAS